MDRFLLYHFKWFEVIVYYNVSAINVCMTFFLTQSTQINIHVLYISHIMFQCQ